MDDFSVNPDRLGDDGFAYAGTSRPPHKDAEDRERECFDCLSGWVF